jgi:hypothetical protein
MFAIQHFLSLLNIHLKTLLAQKPTLNTVTVRSIPALKVSLTKFSKSRQSTHIHVQRRMLR